MMAVPGDLVDALVAPDGAAAFRALDTAGKLTAFIPELEAGRGFTQPELHYYDVLDHNLAAVAALDRALDPGEATGELRAALDWIDFDEALRREVDGLPLGALTRLACLVHDVAKPYTAVFEGGRLRFPRHGPRGAEMLRERLPLLGFAPEATDIVCRLVRYHLRPAELVKGWPVTDKAVRKFVNDLDGYVLPLMLVNLADGMAAGGPRHTDQNYRRHCSIVRYVVARSIAVGDEGEPPLVTGDDLIHELSLESGRLLGAVLTSVRRAQLEGTISKRDDALVLARSVTATLRAESG